MSVELSTTTHNNPLASSTCDECWKDGDVAQGLSLLDSIFAGTGNVINDRELPSEIRYNGEWMDGRYGYDQICIGEKCVEKQTVFVAEEEDSNIRDPLFAKPTNGAIGLARPGKPFHALPEDIYIPEANDFILGNNETEWGSKSFAMHLRTSDDSSVTFGQSDLFADGTIMTINEDYFWSSYMEGAGKWGGPMFRFGNSTEAEIAGTWSPNGEGLYTIFDSTSEDILISSIFFDSLVEEVFGGNARV